MVAKSGKKRHLTERIVLSDYYTPWGVINKGGY